MRIGPSSCARVSKSRFRPPIPRRCRSRPWNSAPTARQSPRRVIMRSPSGKRPTARFESRLAGLAERIYDIAYSPDGKWMATASGDPGVFGVAKLWRNEPGGCKPVRDLAETQDVVFSVAFSPDNKKIATAGADRTIRIFEVETGKLLSQIEDHADWIFGVAWSPDGKRLASASRDKTAKVFDIEKKESLVTFPGHAQPVYTVSFTPDGKGVATGGEDNRIRVWNPDNDGKAIRDMSGFSGTVFKLRIRPTAKRWSRAPAIKRSSSSARQDLKSASFRGTMTGSIRWRSHATARPSHRGAGTAKSGCGTRQTAS